ncbi:MAG: hypothetical protein BWY75_02958 [bacterium ADurb.Bin425]|nr:MAG: hypothetical protein BWY75_02958 [bacterium ADurb.Bin425]
MTVGLSAVPKEKEKETCSSGAGLFLSLLVEESRVASGLNEPGNNRGYRQTDGDNGYTSSCAPA